MIIVKDIDGIHRVLDEQEFYEAFMKSVGTYFEMTSTEILTLKKIKEIFNLEDEEDVYNFIYDHQHCHAE